MNIQFWVGLRIESQFSQMLFYQLRHTYKKILTWIKS